MRDACKFALVGVREALHEVGGGNPGDLGDLGVFVVKLTIDVAQEMMMDRLVDATPLRYKPIICLLYTSDAADE